MEHRHVGVMSSLCHRRRGCLTGDAGEAADGLAVTTEEVADKLQLIAISVTEGRSVDVIHS